MKKTDLTLTLIINVVSPDIGVLYSILSREIFRQASLMPIGTDYTISVYLRTISGVLHTLNTPCFNSIYALHTDALKLLQQTKNPEISGLREIKQFEKTMYQGITYLSKLVRNSILTDTSLVPFKNTKVLVEVLALEVKTRLITELNLFYPGQCPNDIRISIAKPDFVFPADSIILF
jgi:hypothetical protein